MFANNQDKLVLPAELEHLWTMLCFVREHAQRLNFTSVEMHQIELAMEEALINVIHYAYKGKKGEVEIDIQILEDQKIQYTIKDRGVPFNPLESERRIDSKKTLEEREEGGLGIIMIKRCMDEVFYERKDPFNILTLIKKRK